MNLFLAICVFSAAYIAWVLLVSRLLAFNELDRDYEEQPK